jgi:hypothetical protein
MTAPIGARPGSCFPAIFAYVWHAGLHASLVQASLEAAEFEMRAQIVWAKNQMTIGRGNYHWQHEPCWYAVRTGTKGNWQGGRKQTTVWEIPGARRPARARHAEAGRLHAAPDREQLTAGRSGLRPIPRLGHDADRRDHRRPRSISDGNRPALRRPRDQALAGIHEGRRATAGLEPHVR